MPIDGTYEVTVSAIGKSVDGTIEMATDGKAVTGIVHIIGQSVPIEAGKLSGNRITGHVHADTPMGRHKLKIDATVDGDSVRGKLKALIGKADFEGRKVSAAA